MPRLEPYAVAIARRDALVQAVLDALNEADLRQAAARTGSWGEVDPLTQRLLAAADALHALEAEQ